MPRTTSTKPPAMQALRSEGAANDQGTPQGRLSAGLTSRVNIVVDLFVVAAACVAANLPAGPSAGASLAWMVPTALCVWIATAIALRQYAQEAYDRSPADDSAMVAVTAMAVITVVALVDLIGSAPIVAHGIGRFALVCIPCAIALRLLLFRRLAAHEESGQDVLIAGAGAMARLTARNLLGKGSRIVGILLFDDETDEDVELLERVADVPVLGRVSDLDRVLRTVPVGEVYIAGLHRRHGDAMQSAIRSCEQLGVPFAIPAAQFRLERARSADERATADGYLHFVSVVPRPGQMAIKRLLDILAAGVALWLLLPLLAVTALLVKLTSRGPILFKQVRVGLLGRPFNMLKFRSMVVDAEELKAKLLARNEQTGPVFKMQNDPRITRIGRIIRKYSIDELPQLLNVLRGDMSLVGPRPAVPSEVQRYEAWQLRRLSVRPGLTCIWQVSGRNQITFEKWMYMDLLYIDHWTLWSDLQLIAKTVPVVVTGRGAS